MFPLQPLSIAAVKKQPVALEEVLYWQGLVACYASHPTEVLNACASCRNEGAAYLSLLTQFVVWKKNVGIVLSDLAAGKDITTSTLTMRIEAAILCIKEARKKVGYYQEREKYLTAVRDGGRHSQFSGIVPLIEIKESWMHSRHGLLHQLVEILPILEALHGVIGAVWSVLSVDMKLMRKSRTDLEANFDLLTSRLPSLNEHINVNQWCALCIRRDSIQLGALGRDLVNRIYFIFHERTTIEFKRVHDHYTDFMADYPLPVDNFTVGY
jgi:hypothetical protein